MKILVTGANRGIGLEICRQLKERGEEVIAVCRSTSNELQDLGVKVFDGIDVTEPASLKTLADELQGQKLDWLFNNAGILKKTSLDDIEMPDFANQFAVNALGPLRTVIALQGNLNEGAKIGMVTSRMGSMADNGSGGAYGYRMSKAALNAASVSLSHDLQPRGIAVAILHPGYVKTEMTSHSGNIGPDESARGLIQRMDELTLETTGTFWHMSGEQLPW